MPPVGRAAEACIRHVGCSTCCCCGYTNKTCPQRVTGSPQQRGQGAWLVDDVNVGPGRYGRKDHSQRQSGPLHTLAMAHYMHSACGSTHASSRLTQQPSMAHMCHARYERHPMLVGFIADCGCMLYLISYNQVAWILPEAWR